MRALAAKKKLDFISKEWLVRSIICNELLEPSSHDSFVVSPIQDQEPLNKKRRLKAD